jgi:hypothetical protein
MGHSSFYFGNRFYLLHHWLMLGGQITLIARQQFCGAFSVHCCFECKVYLIICGFATSG